MPRSDSTYSLIPLKFHSTPSPLAKPPLRAAAALAAHARARQIADAASPTAAGAPRYPANGTSWSKRFPRPTTSWSPSRSPLRHGSPSPRPGTSPNLSMKNTGDPPTKRETGWSLSRSTTRSRLSPPPPTNARSVLTNAFEQFQECVSGHLYLKPHPMSHI
jgi:outer membrane protein TolC